MRDMQQPRQSLACGSRDLRIAYQVFEQKVSEFPPRSDAQLLIDARKPILRQILQAGIKELIVLGLVNNFTQLGYGTLGEVISSPLAENLGRLSGKPWKSAKRIGTDGTPNKTLKVSLGAKVICPQSRPTCSQRLPQFVRFVFAGHFSSSIA
jgi:hypothetical protein